MEVETRLKIVGAGITPPLLNCYEMSWPNGSLRLEVMQFVSNTGGPDIIIEHTQPIVNLIMPIDLTQPPLDISLRIMAAMALDPQLPYSSINVVDNGTTVTATFYYFLQNNYTPLLYQVDGNILLFNPILCP